MKNYKTLPLSLIACFSASLCHSYQTANGFEHSYIKDTISPTLTVAHNTAETIGEKAHDARLSAQYAAHVTKETAQDVAKNVQEKAHDISEAVQEKAQAVSSAVQHKAQNIKDTLYEKAIQVEAAILAAQNKNLHKKLDKANKEIDRLRNENQHITGEREVTQRNVQIACDKVNDVDQELHKMDKVIDTQ